MEYRVTINFTKFDCFLGVMRIGFTEWLGFDRANSVRSAPVCEGCRVRVSTVFLMLISMVLLTGCGGDTGTASPTKSAATTIDCTLDDESQTVTCQATGYSKDADRLHWWTNWTNAEADGEFFSFTITRGSADSSVMFEECKSGNCETVITVIDTAHLMSTGSDTVNTPGGKPATPITVPTVTPNVAPGARPVTTIVVPTVGRPSGECWGGHTTPSNPHPIFTHELVALDNIERTAPPGSVFSGMLKRHAYFFVGSGMPEDEWSGYPRSVPLYAPIESWLLSVHVYQNSVAGNDVFEYEFVFEVSCEVRYKLGHLGPLIERIEESGPFELGHNRLSEPIHFDGGELVSYWSGVNPGGNIDLGVYNKTVKQTLANPERMTDGFHENQRYEDCPFDYFPESLRSQYYALLSEENTGEPVKTDKCRRSAEHEIAGTISGEWFVPNRYASVLAIGTSLLGSARVSFGDYVVPGGASVSVGPGEASHIDPGQVTTEHCYETVDRSRYASVKLLSSTELYAEYGSGTCADRTPIATVTAIR